VNAQFTLEDLKRSGRATINVEECAALLQIGRGKAYELCRNNELPGVLRLGAHKVLIAVPALLRWLGDSRCSSSEGGE
jgi:predicted DNA-binding transcriptional regulator AlpA